VDAGFLLAMLALGAVSSVHCVGMCGGIVAAYSSAGRVIPIREAKPVARLAAFNAGRLCTYATLGSIAGIVGGLLEAQVVLYVVANVALILAGLHLVGFGPLSRIEALAAPLWRRMNPLLPTRSGFLSGLLWGFLPCGLVYGALAAAAFAGSPAGGAAAMLAFGIGTLPLLLGASLAFTRLRGRLFRSLAGGGVLAFGVYGLAHAGEVADGIRRGLFCF
jgi:sulfite exporter TauE/SafE